MQIGILIVPQSPDLRDAPCPPSQPNSVHLPVWTSGIPAPTRPGITFTIHGSWCKPGLGRPPVQFSHTSQIVNGSDDRAGCSSAQRHNEAEWVEYSGIRRLPHLLGGYLSTQSEGPKPLIINHSPVLSSDSFVLPPVRSMRLDSDEYC